MTGKLIVCPTPIGNMEDMTERGKRVLAEADLIAAEDTRHTLGLLNHLGIKTPMISCHQHNEQERTEQILGKNRGAGERRGNAGDFGSGRDPSTALL